MESVAYLAAASIVAALLILVGVESVSFIVRRAARAAGVGRVVIRDLGAFARVIEVVLVALAVTRIVGLSSDITTLTFSGIGALAASLALQGTLSNIIAGILLLSDGVIHFGDVVEYSGVKGQVVRIALRNTWIKTEDGSIAVVSNTSLSNGPLINHTAVDRLKKRYAFE